MINLRAKIEKSIRTRGLTATLRMSLYNLYYYGKKLTPAHLYTRYKERAFDRAFDVDTAGRIDLSDLGDVVGLSAQHGIRYEPIDPYIFHEVMAKVKELGLDLSATTFIDYGCGKGRAVLLASHYPFRRIVGIEISKRLEQTAVENLRRYRAPGRVCLEIAIDQADALEWDPPNEPSLFYLYHPFEAELLDRVLARIRQSLRRQPRKAWILHVGAMEEVLGQAEFLRPLAVQSDRHPRHGIYECAS